MKRILVLKIGTKSIVTPGGKIRRDLLKNTAADVARVMKKGWKVIIVSSGAIAFGKNHKLVQGKKLTKQNYAMIGQNKLVGAWQKFFEPLGIPAGQVLYENKSLRGESRESVTEVLMAFLRIGVPVVNENDGITNEEIRDLFGFGDNDQLAALISKAVKAEKVIFLTTVPGIYDKAGKIIRVINARERKIQNGLCVKSGDSNGGMPSKLKAGKMAALAGSEAIIASYKEKDILTRLIKGEEIGTKIVA